MTGNAGPAGRAPGRIAPPSAGSGRRAAAAAYALAGAAQRVATRTAAGCRALIVHTATVGAGRGLEAVPAGQRVASSAVARSTGRRFRKPGGIPMSMRDENGRLAGKKSGGWYRRSLGINMKVIGGRVRLAASDVANFLACRRLTQLDLLWARGKLRPPREFDVGFQELVRRGEVHERGVLERFRADGLTSWRSARPEDAASATAAAIRGGAGVIFQGTLTGGGPGAAAVRAAGFPGAGGPAACAGRGGAAGRDPLRGGRRQAGPVREGACGAADRVLLAPARRRAGDRAAVDAPGAGQRGVRPVQGE